MSVLDSKLVFIVSKREEGCSDTTPTHWASTNPLLVVAGTYQTIIRWLNYSAIEAGLLTVITLTMMTTMAMMNYLEQSFYRRLTLYIFKCILHWQTLTKRQQSDTCE